MNKTGSLKLRPGGKYIVGVDPGKTTGICILDSKTNTIVTLWTGDFWDIYWSFNRPSIFLKGITQFWIEQPSLIKSLYARHADQLIKYQSKVETRDKIVWDAGGNAREGILLRDGLRRIGYTVFDAMPVGRKKWNAADFKRYMGWAEKSNQHVRDAAFLVHGMGWRNK